MFLYTYVCAIPNVSEFWQAAHDVVDYLVVLEQLLHSLNGFIACGLLQSGGNGRLEHPQLHPRVEDGGRDEMSVPKHLLKTFVQLLEQLPLQTRKSVCINKIF